MNARAWFNGSSAYVLWGLLPLFWKYLSHVSPVVVVANRVIWSTACLGLLVWAYRKSGPSLGTFRKQLRWYTASAILLSLNWGSYIWAVTNGYVLASSLGYFLAPLLYVAAGALVLGERLSKAKIIATFFGGLAVVPLIAGSDVVTLVVAATLSISFVFYALLRKKGSLGALNGLFLESFVMTMPALAYLVWTQHGHVFDPSWNLATNLLLIAAGPVTLLPLLFFSAAVRVLPLSSIGFLQYISPILQFLLAIAVFGEVVASERLLAFLLVWAGIAILIVGETAAARASKAA